MKIGYRTLTGGTSTAYLDCGHDNQHFTCTHGADGPHTGADKYTEDPVTVRWNGTDWTELAAGYNPAHYRAYGEDGWAGAEIRCTQCSGNASLVYTVHAREDEDPQFLDLIINATRQHHDDHHEGK